MKNIFHFLHRITSVLLLIFLSEILFEPLSIGAVWIIQGIHQSPFNPFLIVFTKIISYGIVGVIAAFFVVHNLIIKPNYLRTFDFIVFLFFSLFLFSFLKSIFGELRPFMFSILEKYGTVYMYDCETDFGMPSGHVFMMTCFFFLFKMRYYTEEDEFFLDNTYERRMTNKDYTYIKINEVVISSKSYFGMDYKLFKKGFSFYIFLVAVCRFIAASHFMNQVIFGCLCGCIWSKYYFAFISRPLKKMILDITFKRGSRQNSIKSINITFYSILTACTILVLTKLVFNNSEEIEVLEREIFNQCGLKFFLGLKNINDSFWGLLVLWMINLVNVVNLSKRIKVKPKKTFYQLSTVKRIIRILIICVPPGFIFLVKGTIDNMVVELIYKTRFDFLNMVNQIMMNLTLAFYLSILLPLLLYNTGVLLDSDFLFKEDFRSKSNKPDNKQINKNSNDDEHNDRNSNSMNSDKETISDGSDILLESN